MVRSNVEETTIAEVAVNAPLEKLFHYRVPEELRGRLLCGHRVLIPFGPRTTTGVCVGFADTASVDKLKPIREILHPECRFDEHLLELTRWISSYYRAPWGEVLEAALPPPIRSGREERSVRTVQASRAAEDLRREAERIGRRAPARSRLLLLLAENPGPHRVPELARKLAAGGGAVRLAVRAAAREGFLLEGEAAAARADLLLDPGAPGDLADLVLSSEQERAVRAIGAALEKAEFAPFLLHGVTGSGKTEIYVRALRQAAGLGRSGLVLVPEIALTPQTVRRFRAGLPDLKVAVLHSMLSPAERAAEWRSIQEGKAQAVIGARSAVFAPLARLGIIIVDEEHEPSYKQDSSPRYHARDVAVMRARLLSVPVVLGSATPSLESYHNAQSGRYRLLELPRRVTPHDLPSISVVELGTDFYRPDGKGLFTDTLDRLMRNRLSAGEQTLLFLNRRGFATYLHCVRCGFVLKCSECDLALTFHRQSGTAHCHLCDARRAVPDNCPECGMPGIRRSGAGTERIMAELARRFPEARTARLDSDAVSGHRALQAILDRFGRGEIDILVGTQMIAKGHDFPRVSLVGIICADTGLHLPDFRAAERTFQLLTQVAGRAGRGDRLGRVVLQTFFPGHYALCHATRGDYAAFYEEEIGHRRLLGYPPFGRAARVLVQGEDEERSRLGAGAAAEALRATKAAQVLGPAPAPIARIQGRYRFQILLKGKDSSSIRNALAALPRAPAGCDMIVDVDPQSLL